MTFYEVQNISDLDLLKSLKERYLLRAEKFKGTAYQENKDAHKYCELCDVVDRLYWRIKEITDESALESRQTKETTGGTIRK